MNLRDAVVQLFNAAYWQDNSGRKTAEEQKALWKEVEDAANLTRDEKGLWR